MGSLVRVFRFLSRRSGGYRPSRGALAMVVLAGIISGAASAGFIALINTVLKSGNHRPAGLVWAFAALCLALPVFRFLASFLLLRLSNRAVMELRLELSRPSPTAAEVRCQTRTSENRRCSSVRRTSSTSVAP
jgi:ABC-type siderophore export system fused ATPase/permease subunit